MKLGSRAKPAIPPVEPGTYFAVCIGAVDLGEQETTYNNKTRYTNQLQIIFELPSELIEIDGEEQPRQLSRRFAVSLSTKSNLRKFIETWYGKKFTDDAIREFDTRELLGKPAMLSVVLSEDGNYANIASADRTHITVHTGSKAALAPTAPVETSLGMMSDANGEMQLVELLPQVAGQMDMDGSAAPEPKVLKLAALADQRKTM